MLGARDGWEEEERHHGPGLATTGEMGDGASTDSDSEEVCSMFNIPYQSQSTQSTHLITHLIKVFPQHTF